ncbi:hypothetical protein [Streptomyces sp. NPDC059894]|uniref:hypothetical protein n=1 Tax=unclassified Streptomyces TaxID=2593676 RepID=UPI00364B4307
MSDGATLIDPSGIPHFIGDLSTLDTDVMLLTANAAQFRASGADVHTTFQGLSAVYRAPEAGDLLSSTQPVKAKADAFADDLEKVASALSDYSAEVQPLIDRLATLKVDATAFVQSLSGDDDWREDQDKVDRNNELWRDVNHTVAAFQAAERACHNKITALVGGSKTTVDDGSHGEHMYGYRADDLDHAPETPWGAPAEREYEGWEWLTHEAGQVWDGFWTDGVMATVHGVGTLFGADGSDAAGEAWKSLAQLATASALTSATLGTWWLLPEEKLPSWLRDSRTAYKQTVKGLVAWDTWKTNPSRAAGAVTFNVLTALGTEGTGAAASGAAKTSAAARALSTAGRIGRAVDPMTYVGKAGTFALGKVGDTFRTLKNLHSGTTLDLLERADALRSPEIPDNAIPYVDAKGDIVYLTEDGHVLDADGSLRQHAGEATHELSADDRSAVENGAVSGRDSQPVHAHARTEATGADGHHASGTGGGSSHHSGETGDATGQSPGRSSAGSNATGGGHDTASSVDHTPNGHGTGHGDGAAPPAEMTPGERTLHDEHLHELAERYRDDFDEMKQDPDHKGKVKPSEMDEARVALDLRDSGKVPSDIQRPPGANQGDLYSPSTGIFYDIKGVHSDWPPLNNVRDKSLPFKGAYDPANNGTWVRKLADQIETKQRVVILDMRNANQAAIDDVKAIIDEHGWSDRVVWYP